MEATKCETPIDSAGDAVSPKPENGLWAEWYAGTYNKPSVAKITNPTANRRTNDIFPLTVPLLFILVADGNSNGNSCNLSI